MESEPGHASGRVIVLESAEWHEGVLGIVAARLVDRYQKPSIVISTRSGVGKGSGRSVPAFSIFEGVRRCEVLLENFGGHAQACGFTIRGENIAAFRSRLNDALAECETLASRPELPIDAEIDPRDIGVPLLKDLERLAPFGPGNRKPLFLSRGLKPKGEPRKRGKDTLQCWMTDRAGRMTCEVVGFRSYARWAAQKAQSEYSLVYQPSLRQNRGIPFIQLELEDWC